MGDGELYDIVLYTRSEGGEEEIIDLYNLPKETKVRDLLPQNWDENNHPFRLNVPPTSVNIDNTLEELANIRISPVHEAAGSSKKLLLLVPVPARAPPENDGNSVASSDSGGSLGSLYRGGGGRKGKSKRKSKRKQRRKSKRKQRKSKSKRR